MVKVVTLNLRGNANRWQERFPLVIDELLASDADIIALQEVRLKIDQHHLIANKLNQSSKSEDYHAHLCEDWYDPHILANAFLSRIPVIEHERIELPEGYRTAQRILVNIDGQQVNIVNTHLHHKPYRDESIRHQQMQMILNWVQDFGHPFILLGDMNARPDSSTIELAKQSLKSAYEEIHKVEPKITFPTPLRADEKMTPRTIDYIFYTSPLNAKTCDLIGLKPHAEDDTLYLSDHYGLVAELHLFQ